jgi:translation initiation factor IF-2
VIKETTVGEIAKRLGNVKINILIEKLKLVGVNIATTDDPVTEEQEQQLLKLLKDNPDDLMPKKISLKRRSSVSQIKVKSATGANSTVNVVRKNRRVYVREEPTIKPVEEEVPVTTPDPAIDEKQINPENTEQASTATVVEQKTTTNKPVKGADNTEDKAAAKSKVTKAKKDKSRDGSDEEEKSSKKSKVKSLKEKNNLPEKINLNLLDVSAANDEDLEDEISLASIGKKVTLARKAKASQKAKKQLAESRNLHTFEKPTAPIKYQVELFDGITVAELAQKVSVKARDLIKSMFQMGIVATINQPIDQDTACLVVEELGHTVIIANPTHLEDSIVIDYDGPIQQRSPIVTVMGHVDHGKTSLLDYIRSTKVTAKEAGGITQHIGAYQVPTKDHGMITFLDTPGHSAFTAMRARGANCTDIVVLIVAADDSVMPQTIEAIQHAKAANVPMIIAINKMDKPGVDPDKVINDLSQHGVMPEDWGGEHIFVKISAKTGMGIDNLLEAITLQAEMLELKTHYTGAAQGIVIESSLDKLRGGVVATLLVQSGTLNRGDIVLAGLEYGKIKSIKSDQGNIIQQATPSMPIEILGLSGAPLAGDKFQVVAQEYIARDIVANRKDLRKEEMLAKQQAAKFSGFMDKMQQSGDDGEIKFINIVLKADVQGSVEAISDALVKLSNETVKINVIAKSVGGFNESDVNLALASKAFLLGFNVRAEPQAKVLAKSQQKDFNYFSIIYDLINAVQSVIEGNTVVPMQDRIIGVAEVREVFRSSKFGTVAGCLVKEGIIKRGNPIRVLRDNVVIYSGELESLRRFKENVNEVRNATECGIAVKNYNDVKVRDQIEVFEVINTSKAAKMAAALKD